MLLPLSLRRGRIAGYFFSTAAILMLAVISFSACKAMAQSPKPQNNAQPNSNRNAPPSQVARGKYIVEGVAMCGMCHTPRDRNGNLDRSQWLQGAPVIWVSPQNDPNWPLRAPRIGGSPPASDEDMVKLLTTGVWTTGDHLRLPMPQFRMDRADAEAVVAYLKSLTPQ